MIMAHQSRFGHFELEELRLSRGHAVKLPRFIRTRGPTRNRPSRKARPPQACPRVARIACGQGTSPVGYLPRGETGEKERQAQQARREPLKLWAVVIIEAVQRTDAFTYEVTLRRIFKRDDRTIKVRVSNDPDDQSAEAFVFGFVSPPATLLTSLEQYLSHVVAKRVYDAIAETWSGGDASGTMSSVVRPPMRSCPKGPLGPWSPALGSARTSTRKCKRLALGRRPAAVAL